MRRDTRIVSWFFGSIPVLILAAATLCTWALSNGAPAFWRLLFRPLCHGMASRSLEMFGTLMPICARCTGVYLGMLVGILTFAAMPWIEGRLLKPMMLIALVPIAVDGVTQALGFRESTNALRVVTGFVAAFAFGIWALNAVERKSESEFELS